jgi:tRNA 2-thiocytidine biosynthesis protein TtcA
MDRKLFPFETLQPTGVASEDGDKAFDADDLPESTPTLAGLPELQVIQLVQS